MQKNQTISLPIILCLCLILNISAQQTDIVGPAGSDSFGQQVTALPNGNIVVTDPFYDIPAGNSNVGAVYLYDGSNGNLISTLIGSTTDDQVGSGGVTVLTNGNYVVISQFWNNGGTFDVGAVTWGNGTTGITGVVSASNSLVGSSAFDRIGEGGVTTLTNGNYVVRSTSWDNGGVDGVGAVTWGNGTTGTTGVVSASNSLVGSTAVDLVGSEGVIALTNGNYVVISQLWDNGGVADVGAVTFGNGTTGISGAISASNSLIGSTADDEIGYNVDGTEGNGVIVLTNGNYVVRSRFWDNGGNADAGAVTFGNGTTGITGVVSASNSLVGSSADDQVGYNSDFNGVTELTNGNYVVRSRFWDNGGVADVGAVTWADGTTGITGVVSASNSLIGSTADDRVGRNGVTALTNGNYVVNSSSWDNGGTANVGAATWADGTTGITGVVSASNSLIGSTAGDSVSFVRATALTNGNYVVSSPGWDNGGTASVGAVTWGDGTTGTTGVVSAANSLVGSTAFDFVGGGGVTALTNGNYVVNSSGWINGGVANAGAITWGDGTTGTTGVVSASNSLVGSSADDQVGSEGVIALTNGNYVVISRVWDNGGISNAGAVTWGDGTTGTTGVVSASNSLVGTTAFDFVGNRGVTILTNGNYVVRSSLWDNGGVIQAGAVTFGNGTTGISGAVSTSNSLVGSTGGDFIGDGEVTALTNGNYVVISDQWDNGGVANVGAISYLSGLTGNSPPPILGNEKRRTKFAKETSINNLVPNMTNSVIGTNSSGGSSMNFSFDAANTQLVVGRPADNIVTLFNRFLITAADVTISGRVTTQSGRGIPRAIVSMTDSEGQIRRVRTNVFGYFKFEDVEAGSAYTFNTRAKGYSFNTQVANINENIEDFKITAN